MQASPEQQKEMADHTAEEQLRFNDRKSEMVKEIGDRITEMQARITEMQQKQSCIQGAANQQAMNACFPNMGGRSERHWEHGQDHGHNSGFGNSNGNSTPPNGVPNGAPPAGH